jgi:hypothetical protein
MIEVERDLTPNWSKPKINTRTQWTSGRPLKSGVQWYAKWRVASATPELRLLKLGICRLMRAVRSEGLAGNRPDRQVGMNEQNRNERQRRGTMKKTSIWRRVYFQWLHGAAPSVLILDNNPIPT